MLRVYNWLAKSGYIAHEVQYVPKQIHYERVSDFQGWLKTTWFPYLIRVGVENEKVFLDEVISRYLVQYPADKNGTISINMVRLEVDATRI